MKKVAHDQRNHSAAKALGVHRLHQGDKNFPVIEAQRALRTAILEVRKLGHIGGVTERLAAAWDWLGDWQRKTGYADPPRQIPTIAELEAILNSEEETPIMVNPDGSIWAGQKGLP
jgi:hypothetical protein